MVYFVRPTLIHLGFNIPQSKLINNNRKTYARFLKNKTNPVCWGTQRGDFNTSFTNQIHIVFPELDAKKNVRCNFCVDDPKVHNRYDMILGHAIFSGLNIDLCLSDNIIRADGGVYKVCTDPIKYVSEIILTCTQIGFNMRHFGTNNYGIAYMYWIPHSVHVTYYKIIRENLTCVRFCHKLNICKKRRV